MTRVLEHERLIVWRRAAGLYRSARHLVSDLSWRDRHLSDQLLRAVASVSLNIAEGASAYRPRVKANYIRIALASAAESTAALFLLTDCNLVDSAAAGALRAELLEIMAMLTALAKRLEGQQAAEQK